MVNTEANAVHFIPDAPGGPVITIDEKGFFYRGALVEDSGEAYDLFFGVLRQMQSDTIKALVEKLNFLFPYAKKAIDLDASAYPEPLLKLAEIEKWLNERNGVLPVVNKGGSINGKY